MKYIADLHIHSSHSRATSRELTLENLWLQAQLKGIRLIGTGDCIHPGWLSDIQARLRPSNDGFLELIPALTTVPGRMLPGACTAPVRFILSTEISCIYKRDGRVRKVHNLIVLPTLESAHKLQARLEAIGNIRSDGRPILGLDSRTLLEIVLECDPRSLFIPAHIWTPWFSVLGSKSGFDSIAECFGDLSRHIYAVETGLSSDPPMNWRVRSLDPYLLISSSDAHSPAKLGREATVFNTEFSFDALHRAFADPTDHGVHGTVEFFPEEGKYHLDGHRACAIRMNPQETISHNGVCPVCEKPVTVGVLSRVEQLSSRPAGEKPPRARQFSSSIPLVEIVAEAHDAGPATKGVQKALDHLHSELGSEFSILMDRPIDSIRAVGGELVAEGIGMMRAGKVSLDAGYDGEFGTVRVLKR